MIPDRIAIALTLLGALILAGCGSSGDSTQATVAAKPPPAQTETVHQTDAGPKKEHGDPESSAFHGHDAARSWKQLEETVPAQVGIAIGSFGLGQGEEFGSLRIGHAWSSIKVPILVTLMRQTHGELSPEEESWARAALTASDNTAAAELFGELEKMDGGLKGASLAVQETLRKSGDESTVVATAPPPPGAVSTYGQTEWSLSGSVDFYRSLGQGCLLDHNETKYVLNLMGEIIPEQQWGLGATSFSPSWQVGYKAGWGPEGSESGPYLVRQSGVLIDGDSGVAVAMIAKDDSGTFEGGIQALNAEAAWLKNNLRGLGPGANSC